MARHSATYSWSSAGGRGGNAIVESFDMCPGPWRVASKSVDELEATSDGSVGDGLDEVDICLSNGVAWFCRQAKDRMTKARQRQKARYLIGRLGFEVTEGSHESLLRECEWDMAE